MLAGALYSFAGFASGRTLWFGAEAGVSSASTSISVPLGRTTSLTGAGLGAILGLLKALEPLVQASDFNGVLSLTPLAQVRQLAAPVRFFKIASTLAGLMVLPCAFAQAAILFFKTAVSRFFLPYGSWYAASQRFWLASSLRLAIW